MKDGGSARLLPQGSPILPRTDALDRDPNAPALPPAIAPVPLPGNGRAKRPFSTAASDFQQVTTVAVRARFHGFPVAEILTNIRAVQYLPINRKNLATHSQHLRKNEHIRVIVSVSCVDGCPTESNGCL